MSSNNTQYTRTIKANDKECFAEALLGRAALGHQVREPGGREQGTRLRGKTQYVLTQWIERRVKRGVECRGWGVGSNGDGGKASKGLELGFRVDGLGCGVWGFGFWV